MNAVMRELPEGPLVEVEEAPQEGWILQELKPKHRIICALIAQGQKNIEVAAMANVTKEYVSMLMRQPLIKQEIARVCEIAGTRLEAMFELSVDAIGDALKNGSHADKMKAVRVHGELTKRIGRPDPFGGPQVDQSDRLERLAERLTGLLDKANMRAGNETAETVPYKEVRLERGVLEGTCTKASESKPNGSAEQDS